MTIKKKKLYNKEISYFSNIRYDIIKLIPKDNNNILEVGCGDGSTLLELKKEGKAKYIAGIDIIDLGQSEKLDKFILADIEMEEIDLPENYFDIVICGDVLEHLVDPWNVLKKLKKFLNNDAIIVASIPNIREIKTMLNIFVKGDFKYVEAGILDKTHLRFFCKKNILNLFEQTEFEIVKIVNNLNQKSKRYIFNLVTFGKFEEFITNQYLIVAKNKDEKS
ncbi:class I SAM-dependent methyltransferase [Calditerrivibrio nitroreducens]|uniref:Methyltransferase type 11 n=1 Tax=Calditerrivibrio nitroreducens (strain DSM 19672 / NBRC 101217 / Yu37-1) TaxID=768670 RepID=E4TIN6_CALNY|nr:class I SAM-dependent methyltransferase [Calditerrivibrio nitroreducens]ADR19084.1 Methyltransferase type 11 [Calditerrivibrio nitroreducens DSM 19672]